MTGEEQTSGAGADPLSDPEVLEGLRRRDREALGRVFDAAFPWIYRLAYRMLGDRASAEDAAQDVFAKVHRAADRVDPSRPLKPWLATIAMNTCRDRIKRRARRPAAPWDPVILERIGHTNARPEYELERKEERELLARALRSLDGKDREIVGLHLDSGQSHEESAKILGISPAAARKRYSRALGRLRDFVRKSRR